MLYCIPEDEALYIIFRKIIGIEWYLKIVDRIGCPNVSCILDCMIYGNKLPWKIAVLRKAFDKFFTFVLIVKYSFANYYI